MGRLLKIELLPEAERIAIDRSIREHRYMLLDEIVTDLAGQGIAVGRSSPHRYVVKLREKDATLATPEEGTIVTIVERSSGEVRLVKDLDRSILDRDVIIVEDIVDSGMTLHFLKKLLITRGAASLRIAALMDKPARRVAPLTVDYSCFQIPDAFVVGYGLDYNEVYRNLPDVGVLSPRIYGQEDE